MPVFIPNYYRGAWREIPRTAGRSSQLFNTGTVAWVYRSIVEGLCGLKGDAEGLVVAPQLPSHWDGMRVQRSFRGARFEVEIRRAAVDKLTVILDGAELPKAHVSGIVAGRSYRMEVLVPRQVLRRAGMTA